MNPPTELGARSLFDGMPQSASVAGGDDDDLISALPDVLLHHVLGFLDAREAVRTCVVAKRWCHLWKSVPVLRVTCPGHVQSHREFLDHILLLLLRDRTNLEVCLFEFERYVPDDAPYLFLLIQRALLCQVRELSFTVSGTGLDGLWMQDLHVVSQHLTRLKLWGLHLPGKFVDFSSCPALQDLDMTDCDIHADKIYSRSLGHLSMSSCTFCSDCWTLISTPSVISLQLHNCYGKHVLSEDMPMLVRATVAMYAWCNHGYDNNTSCSRCYPTDDGSAGCVFLKGLSAARTLELIAEPGMVLTLFLTVVLLFIYCFSLFRCRTCCWGSGPAHVRVSGLLYELEGLLVNIVSVRGSEENSLQGFGGKLPTTPIPIYRRVIVIDGTSIKWWRTPK